MDGRSYFIQATQLMLEEHGEGPAPGDAPVPMVAFKLLRAVDHLFTRLQCTDTPLDLVRFRFSGAFATTQLRLSVQKSEPPPGSGPPLEELGPEAKKHLKYALNYCNCLISPLMEEDRQAAVALAFEAVSDPLSSVTRYQCRPEDIRPHVERLLTPESGRLLRAMQLAHDMAQDTTATDQPLHGLTPRF